MTQRFWHAVRDLLIAVEERVAYQCLTQGGLPEAQVQAVVGHRSAIRGIIARANSGEAIADLPASDQSAEWFDQMWGDWAGREHEWFEQCADFTATMANEELLSWTEDSRGLATAVVQRFAELGIHEIPELVTFSPGPGSEATPDVLRLVGYSPFDPLILPARLLADLQRLDGRPIAQVRAEVQPGETPLTSDLLSLLQDFRVAVVPSPEPM